MERQEGGEGCVGQKEAGGGEGRQGGQEGAEEGGEEEEERLTEGEGDSLH